MQINLHCPNIWHMCNSFNTETAKMYMLSMVFTHLSYCIPRQVQSGDNSIKPIQSLYKLALNILEKKIHATSSLQNTLSLIYSVQMIFVFILMFVQFCFKSPTIWQHHHHSRVVTLCSGGSRRNTRSSSRVNCITQYGHTSFG